MGAKNESPVGLPQEKLSGFLHTIADLLELSERIILVFVAVVMAALAIFLLATSVYAIYMALITAQVPEQAIEILNSILLVMMISEIVHTAIISMKDRKLEAEPFLIVGVIAAIRRMLVITAESTKFEVANIETFKNMLVELGLLALTILLIAVAFYILRRSRALAN